MVSFSFPALHFFMLFFLLVVSCSNVSAQEERKYVRGGAGDAHERKNAHGAVRDSAPERTASRRRATEAATRRVIIKYKTKTGCVDAMTGASLHRANGEPEIEIDFDFPELNTFVVTASEDSIHELEKSPEVESVEEDPIRTLFSAQDSNADGISRLLEKGRRNLVESVPYGVELVEAPELWARGFTGQGVKVCVIDSGIDEEHPDFVSSRLSGSGTGSVTWSEDGCGHGTHVAGTIAAKDDTKGVIGVAPDAEIFAVRVFEDDCGISFASEIYLAAQTCKANGANIISMSLGGPQSSTFERNVYKGLFEDDNILLVASAGNEGDSSFSYPASYDSVMSVAAVDESKTRASFSQYNSQVDIAAPGVDVLSTFPVGGCTICGFGDSSGYGSTDGTSMACPHVSAVAALLLSAVPGTKASELWDALTATAEDRGSSGRDNFYGHGIVRANEAYEFLAGGGGGTPTSPPGGGSSCQDISGWYDSWGPAYDCDWYSQFSRCEEHGDDYENFGATANEACCACGGGDTDSTSPTPTPPTPTSPPSTPPPSSPTPPPSGGGQEDCTDVPGWYDADGPEYDCEWYSEETRCADHGGDYANFGYTANEACCACGGGETDSTSPTPTPPTPTPLPSTPSSPTPPPSGGGQEDCTDVPGWYDADGPEFDCEWYSEETRCADHGDSYANFGYTANEACCACGGGGSGDENGQEECSDTQGWYDSWGPDFDCDWYSQFGRCQLFGDHFANVDGQTANEACCACGGGSPAALTHPESYTHPTRHTHPETHCLDTPGWSDSAGEDFDCAWYALEDNCEVYGNDFENDGKTAKQACCACGGGSNEKE